MPRFTCTGARLVPRGVCHIAPRLRHPARLQGRAAHLSAAAARAAPPPAAAHTLRGAVARGLLFRERDGQAARALLRSVHLCAPDGVLLLRRPRLPKLPTRLVGVGRPAAHRRAARLVGHRPLLHPLLLQRLLEHALDWLRPRHAYPHRGDLAHARLHDHWSLHVHPRARLRRLDAADGAAHAMHMHMHMHMHMPCTCHVHPRARLRRLDAADGAAQGVPPPSRRRTPAASRLDCGRSATAPPGTAAKASRHTLPWPRSRHPPPFELRRSTTPLGSTRTRWR